MPIEWKVQTLRLTVFPSGSTVISEVNWWESLLGQPPDSQTSKPKTGLFSQEGVFESGKLTLNVQPGRIDWLWTTNESQEEQIPILGPLSTTLDNFSAIMTQWLEKMCPPVRRLAIGGILLDPVENKQIGYKHLTEYLPYVKLDPERSFDFTYRINRPRNSTVMKDLTINRLTNWLVAMWKVNQMALAPDQLQYIPGPEFHACRLDLDMSTQTDYLESLPQESLVNLFRELISLGTEIATRGDIP